MLEPSTVYFPSFRPNIIMEKIQVLVISNNIIARRMFTTLNAMAAGPMEAQETDPRGKKSCQTSKARSGQCEDGQGCYGRECSET